MTRRPHRATKGAAPSGTWLAFLALAMHVLVPFFVAGDFASASTRANLADTIVICTAYGTKTVPVSHQGESHHRHGLLNGCPICTALAAGQSVPLSEPPVLPLPQTEAIASLRAAASSRASSFSAAYYHSRAPPSIA